MDELELDLTETRIVDAVARALARLVGSCPRLRVLKLVLWYNDMTDEGAYVLSHILWNTREPPMPPLRYVSPNGSNVITTVGLRWVANGTTPGGIPPLLGTVLRDVVNFNQREPVFPGRKVFMPSEAKLGSCLENFC